MAASPDVIRDKMICILTKSVSFSYANRYILIASHQMANFLRSPLNVPGSLTAFFIAFCACSSIVIAVAPDVDAIVSGWFIGVFAFSTIGDGSLYPNHLRLYSCQIGSQSWSAWMDSDLACVGVHFTT